MSSDSSPKAMDPFFLELRERCLADAVLEINEIETQLLQLSSQPLEVLRELMKVTHSLKGNMQAVGFNPCAELLHQFETAVLATSEKIRTAGGLQDSDAPVLEFLLSDAIGGLGSHVHWIRSSGEDSAEKAATREPALALLQGWELSDSGTETSVPAPVEEMVSVSPPPFREGSEPEAASPPEVGSSDDRSLPLVSDALRTALKEEAKGEVPRLFFGFAHLALPAPAEVLALPAPLQTLALPALPAENVQPEAAQEMDLLSGLDLTEPSSVSEAEISALRSEYESVTLLEDSEIGLGSSEGPAPEQVEEPAPEQAKELHASWEVESQEVQKSDAFEPAAAAALEPVLEPSFSEGVMPEKQESVAEDVSRVTPAPVLAAVQADPVAPSLRLLPRPAGETPESGLFLLFQNDRRDYAIPIQYVREIVRTQPWTPLPSSRSDVLGIVSIHGQVVPILDLSSVIGKRSPDREKYLMICRRKQQVFGFPVENAEQVIWLEKEKFQGLEALEGQTRSEMVRGVAVQEGRMVLVLDLDPQTREAKVAA